MRTVPLLEDTYYHIYNRGNQKQTLFYDKYDYARFLYLILYFQSEIIIPQTNRHIQAFVDKGDYKVKDSLVEEITSSRFVEAVNFCIMPNHFHITLHNISEGGISKYMHRISNAYAKYFNTKYERTGHVFQGAYKTKIVENDKYLCYLSAYIHRNPEEMGCWNNKSVRYPWSSYNDYYRNRWGNLLVPDMVMENFNDFHDYQRYVESSGAKEDFLI